jgi:AbiV family abortive infection protein
MPKQNIPVSISPDSFLAIGQATITNAFELADDARLLAAHSRWSRATALMITAREEGGKGYYAALIGIGVMPEKRPTERGLISSIDVLFKRHREKQAFGALLDQAVVMWGECRLLRSFEGVLKGVLDAEPKDLSDVERILVRFGERLSGLDVGPSCLRRVVTEAEEVIKSEVNMSTSEDLRQRALYVGLSEDGESVETPSGVTEVDYGAEADKFDRAEKILSVFTSVEISSEAASMMRRLLAKQSEQIQAENRARRAGQ